MGSPKFTVDDPLVKNPARELTYLAKKENRVSKKPLNEQSNHFFWRFLPQFIQIFVCCANCQTPVVSVFSPTYHP